ncbi:hypothetical protein N9L68_07645, partial [bacterium]|nr:hypothetical protein [bacterium]
VVDAQKEQQQRDIWDRKMRRRTRSPEALRSGHQSSELSLERCSSMSRSPGACERLARSETCRLAGVSWERHIGILNPDIKLIANHARVAIRSWPRSTEAGPTFFRLESLATFGGDGWEGII